MNFRWNSCWSFRRNPCWSYHRNFLPSCQWNYGWKRRRLNYPRSSRSSSCWNSRLDFRWNCETLQNEMIDRWSSETIQIARGDRCAKVQTEVLVPGARVVLIARVVPNARVVPSARVVPNARVVLIARVVRSTGGSDRAGGSERARVVPIAPAVRFDVALLAVARLQAQTAVPFVLLQGYDLGGTVHQPD